VGSNKRDLLGHEERWIVLIRVHQRRRQAGFSLIELMIGLAIFGVLLAIGIPAFQSYSVNTKLLAGAQSLMSGLQRARAEAIRTNRAVQLVLTDGINDPNTTSLSATGQDWIVRSFNLDTASYDFVHAKAGAEGGITGSVIVSATDAAAGPLTTIEFNGLGGTTLLSVATIAFAPVNGTCATATTPSDLRCVSVIVTPGGRTQICDPTIAATATSDTRRCITT